jgi:hypothetical protein
MAQKQAHQLSRHSQQQQLLHACSMRDAPRSVSRCSRQQELGSPPPNCTSPLWHPLVHMADSEPAEAAAGTAPEEVQAEDVSADEVVAAESEPSDGDYPDGSEDAATPEVLSPSYRPPRDPVTLGTYVALKACKVRSMPDMDSEEEGTYMKGDSFEITEAVEISIKGEAPKVRAKTSMGWITVADNVELKVEETPREQKTDNKLGEYLVISKKGIKVRKGAELDSEPLEYPLDEGAVFEVKEVKLIESTNKKGTTTDVLRGRYADGWVSLKDGMVEHLDVAAMSPGRSPMKGGRRGSVAQDGPSQVMAEAARVALEEGAEAEKIFEVTQGHIKKKGKQKISENVQLKVGAMNVQIFDGPLPVETYLYTMIKRWCVAKQRPSPFFPSLNLDAHVRTGKSARRSSAS